MDPMPFHHCDLDTDAQEYLESWAMEYPTDHHFRVILHIAVMPDDDPETTEARKTVLGPVAAGLLSKYQCLCGPPGNNSMWKRLFFAI